MDAQEQLRLMAEVERDEAWLAGVIDRFPPPECEVLAGVKHRVRIAVYEQAVGMRHMPAPEPSPVVLDCVKAAVRSELEVAEPVAPSPQVAGSLKWRGLRLAFGTLAAAAVLVIAFVPFGGTETNTGTGGGLTVDAAPAIEDFVEYVAQASLNEGAEFALLESEIDELEQRVVSPLDTWFDDEVGDVDYELDRLTGDSDWSLDV